QLRRTGRIDLQRNEVRRDEVANRRILERTGFKLATIEAVIRTDDNEKRESLLRCFLASRVVIRSPSDLLRSRARWLRQRRKRQIQRCNGHKRIKGIRIEDRTAHEANPWCETQSVVPSFKFQSSKLGRRSAACVFDLELGPLKLETQHSRSRVRLLVTLLQA